jgi:hypothetical protein
MSKNHLMVGILAVAAVIIIAMAVYIFTHFNSMELVQEIILICIALVVLVVIMGVLLMLVRNAGRK